MGSKPRFFQRSIESGALSALLMSADSLSTIGRGVLAGAKMPYQPSIGRSGAEGERVAQVWASALTLPARACGSADGRLSNMKVTRPLIRSGMAAELPRYGTCVALMPARLTKSSAATCWELPGAAEA